MFTLIRQNGDACFNPGNCSNKTLPSVAALDLPRLNQVSQGWRNQEYAGIPSLLQLLYK